jgi:hypothetical protein
MYDANAAAVQKMLSCKQQSTTQHACEKAGIAAVRAAESGLHMRQQVQSQ